MASSDAGYVPPPLPQPQPFSVDPETPIFRRALLSAHRMSPMKFNVFERADGAFLLLPSSLCATAGADRANAGLRSRGALDCDLSVFSAELVTELGLHGQAIVTARDRDLLLQRMRATDAASSADDERIPIAE